MIPATMMHSLLNHFKTDILKKISKSPQRSKLNLEKAEDYYRTFYDLLSSAEDDLSFVFTMIEQDPDCRYNNKSKSLTALLDYVNITLAIYEPKTQSTRL